jgi:hypothetical protein
MPCPVQLLFLVFSETANLEIIEQFVESLTMQYINSRKCSFAAPNSIHRRMIARPPSISESFPITLDACSCSQVGQLPDDGPSPVDDRAERVEDKSLDILNAHETSSGAFMKRAACAKRKGGWAPVNQ